MIRTTLTLFGNRVATASDFPMHERKTIGGLHLMIEFDIDATGKVWAQAADIDGRTLAPPLNHEQIKAINVNCRAYARSLHTIQQGEQP